MAKLNAPQLIWTGDSVDPGYRKVKLPEPVPTIGDDFDWDQRDFEGFRQTMWQELQAQFPERRRWSAGDMEAVLVELLAAHLDQLSDMADRVSAEAYLETSRRFESVLKWLSFIGYNPLEARGLDDDVEALRKLYQEKPHEMELDKRRGPASIRRQRRMASLLDYEQRLAAHPLVHRAQASKRWNGSWWEIVVIVSLWEDWRLDDVLMDEAHVLPLRIQSEVIEFQNANGLRKLPLEDDPTIDNPTIANPTIRELLLDYTRAFRMAGHVVTLVDVVLVGVVIELQISIKDNYFQSEVRREVARALGRGPDGFFRSGRLAFGQDLWLSDLYEVIMAVEGVKNVTFLRFGKAAASPAAGSVPNFVEMEANELATCDNRGNGHFVIQLTGGRRG